MKMVKFYQNEGLMRLKLEGTEDLWTAQRIIFSNDIVRSKSLRRFKANESDTGELKEVVVSLRVEKTELDKTAMRLRITGKIVEGKPEQYIKLNSYHTLNVASLDTIDIIKQKWPEYLVGVVKEAVKDTKKPRLGIIVVDDEKALPAYLLGYGVEFKSEIYSNLSKRMSQKDFQEQQKKYYEAVINAIEGMDAESVILAGPGFTKDDIKSYLEAKQERIGKNIIYMQASNTERSGIYEIIKSPDVANLLRRERIRHEFMLMEEFLRGLAVGTSKYGLAGVKDAIEAYQATIVLVNDSVLGEPSIQSLLAAAEEKHLRIEVFNSGDEVGQQLASFKEIASLVSMSP
ncbi:mRNA surveillance protein pelota [Candidatus Marsarchaeota archaeon]|nr:mRNA surveillance protein pelota [Candidatus Marsarchaeota archaeon]MCL5404734.1 mRNA surveillance protein pelota [Candidatus Marsarchaeota archaeon]